jgi:hypothetical protein
LPQKVEIYKYRIFVNIMTLPAPSTPTYELTLPSTGKKIKFRPFLVKEEKILLLAEQSEDEKEIKDAIKSVIENCLVTKLKIEDLSYFDFEYIFLQLRARSAEEHLDLVITCKDDNKTKVDHRIDLLKVQVEKSKKSESKIMLSDDMGIVLRYPGIDEFVKFAMMGKILPDSEVVEYVASKVSQIFQGEDVWDSEDLTQDEIVEWLDKLTQKQFVKIGEFFENLPVLRHKFKIKNPTTGVESEYALEGLQSFFV